MTWIVALFTLLAVNAIPAVGWFVEDWSAGTTLVVYWFENVATCLFMAARIVAHQRRNPRRGHFMYQGSKSRGRGAEPSFVKGFLTTSLAFSAAHGVLLAAILFVLTKDGHSALADVDWRSVRLGCLGVLIILVIDFVVGLPGLRRQSFWQLEQTANRTLGRIVVVHLTLVIGMFAVAITDAPSAVFGVFVVLKTLYAVSLALPQPEPATPPHWLSRMMNRLPNANAGQTFEEAWVEGRAEDAKRREQNEEPWPAHGG